MIFVKVVAYMFVLIGGEIYYSTYYYKKTLN